MYSAAKKKLLHFMMSKYSYIGIQSEYHKHVLKYNAMVILRNPHQWKREILAMLWLRGLASCLSPRRPWFDSGTAGEWLLLNKVPLGLVSSAYFSFPLPVPFQQCSIVIDLSPTHYGLSNRLRHYVTTWSRVLPEKLTVPQLVYKFPVFYGTPKVHYHI